MYQLPGTPDKSLLLVFFCLFGVPPIDFGLFILYLTNRYSQAYVGSLFFNDSSPIIFHLIFAAYEFVMGFAIFINTTTYPIYFFTSQDVVVFWLNQFSQSKNTRYGIRNRIELRLIYLSNLGMDSILNRSMKCFALR